MNTHVVTDPSTGLGQQWRRQRDLLDELEDAHAVERFRRLDDIRKRMRALKDEAADTLAEMDRRHAQRMAEEERKLAKLIAFRDA